MRRGRRYRYHVSRALVRGSTAEGQRGWRVPGPELERAVAIAARSILHDKAAILEALQGAGMGDTDVNQVFTLADEWRERLLSEMDRSTALVELVEKAVLTDEGIRLGLNIPVPRGRSDGAALRKVLHLVRFVPLKVKRRGVEMRHLTASARIVSDRKMRGFPKIGPVLPFGFAWLRHSRDTILGGPPGCPMLARISVF